MSLPLNKQLSYIKKYRKYSFKEIADELHLTDTVPNIFKYRELSWDSQKQLTSLNDYENRKFFMVTIDVQVDKNFWYGDDYANQYLTFTFTASYNDSNLVNSVSEKIWRICQIGDVDASILKNFRNKTHKTSTYISAIFPFYRDMDCSLTELVDKIKKTRELRLNKIRELENKQAKDGKSLAVSNISFNGALTEWADNNNFKIDIKGDNVHGEVIRLNPNEPNGLSFRIAQIRVKKYNKVFANLYIYSSAIEFKHTYYFTLDDTDGLCKTMENLLCLNKLPLLITDYHKLLDK